MILNEYKGNIEELEKFLLLLEIELEDIMIIKDFTNSPIIDKYKDDLNCDAYYLLRIKNFDPLRINQVLWEDKNEVFALQKYESEEEKTPEIFEYLNKK